MLYDVITIVQEFTTKFREAGLKVGLYYSILDYHHGVENGTTTIREAQFIKNQITELLTNYGKIDYINFDGWSTWPTTPCFDDINYGEILALVKSLQPECIIVSHTYESNLARITSYNVCYTKLLRMGQRIYRLRCCISTRENGYC